MVVTFWRRPGADGRVTTAGRSAVARVASCSAIAAPERPRFGAAIILRAGPAQVGQSMTSGRSFIEYSCAVTSQPDLQRNT
ncbi:hypothetical protein BV510_14780 [Mycolicibacterium diernhoferi]|uniref:Uncharacterized protein n=1 Tax=Mycolicibacterium diernhoferi TaxID=1801 RepID=A0A1T3WIA4_9MYCO|nr:hypothetical protein BV510_14780 [Mycolicibacterium diernhoferi]